MGDWRVSFAMRGVKTLMPFKNQLRALKARYAKPYVSDYHLSVIEGAVGQIDVLRRLGLAPEGKRAMEIGSGWYPVMPLMYRLAGAEHVRLTDVEPLMHAANVAATVEFMRKHKARIVGALGIDEEQFERVLGAPLDGALEPLLARLGLSYVLVNKGWDGVGKVDVIFSHTTLEHIPPAVLRAIFLEARTALNPGGVMSHGVDHTDHRSNEDERLSRIDFLRYSDRMWTMLCVDPLDYTNRWRHSDYMKLFADTEYELLYEHPTRNEEMARDAKTLPLWGRFKQMDETDAATAWSHFVARPL